MVAAQLLAGPVSPEAMAITQTLGLLMVVGMALLGGVVWFLAKASRKQLLGAVLVALVGVPTVAFAQLVVTSPPFPPNCDPWILLMFFICWIW